MKSSIAIGVNTMTIQYQVPLREVNQNFAQYIKDVESGDEIIVTRRGVPVARIVGISAQKKLSAEQLQARSRILEMMHTGLSLKGQLYKRDELHDR
jgi:prevent-host-death family protein